MTGIAQDIRYALRGLIKNPGFTLIAVLTLALGIGANTAMFTVLTAALRPLPYPDSDQLVMLWTEQPNQGLGRGRSTYRDVEQWRAGSKTIEGFAVSDPAAVRLTAPGELEQISVLRTSPSYFRLLGVQPGRGRFFTDGEADERRRVAVLSHDLWQSRFGGTDAVLGSTIELDGMRSEIIGVLPSGFGGDVDVWEPHTLFADWEQRRGPQGDAAWFVLARIRPGLTIQQAQTELSAIARVLDEERPAAARGRGISVMPYKFHIVNARTRLALWMLAGAVFCVLLIGITNIISLSLARSVGRAREVALRTALGASRTRILRQLLTESLVLAAVSGIIGIAIAFWGTSVIAALKPATLVFPAELAVDARVLAGAVALSLLTGMLVGLVPAITTARDNVKPALQEAGRGHSGSRTVRFARHALIVAEFAMAIVLLIGAGLLIRSLMNVQNVALGYNPDRVLSLQLSLPPYPANAQRTEYYRQVIEQVESVGGVERAGVVGDLFVSSIPEQLLTVEIDRGGMSRRLRLRRDEMSDGLFTTLQIPLRRGRMFSVQDGADAPPVAIINESMARQLWASEDALGKRFKFGGAASPAPWFTVVGIAADMRRRGFEEEPSAQMFEPLAQNPSRLATLLVRTSSDPAGIAAAVQAAVRRVDNRAPAYGVTPLTSRLATFQAERRFQTSLLGAFSLLALVLAAIGIYGVIQYSTATRTREIGVRMAVGAQRGDIFRMIVGEGLKLSLIGVAIGVFGALWLSRLGSSLLFGVAPTDPVTYAGVAGLLTAVAIAGCYFPARRAAGVNPIAALKYE
jgi:putative ABC transport system permease protein